ncbi:hypothetical protein AJ79_07815 [Helicocarpus griseus UAMH5409]|uniref:Fungal-type protein kinase domain-containing protein n=1 Tax=Helicocarpus griseus UAMH5409 TaxID=1447875 RepID=A0A2B7WYW6_9EURO|nr:hypothetical protein AJ79_07815 [Helicocarpus griseus UAMH5409]
MVELSAGDRDIISNHPLTDSVDELRGMLEEAEKIYESRLISYDGSTDGPPGNVDQLYRIAVSTCVSVLLRENAAYRLRSRMSNEDSFKDPPPTAETDDVELWNINIWKAALNLIATISRMTPPASVLPTFDGTPVRSTSSSQKGSEQTRELVNPRIFEEICGCTFRDVDGFFDKYFEGKDWSDKADAICQHVLASDSDGNWAQFPDPPTQDNVLAWWFCLQEDLLSESRSIYYTTVSKTDLTGSKAERQVDLLLRARG